jgi:hypothetical protein
LIGFLKDQNGHFVRLNYGLIELNASSKDQIGYLNKLIDGLSFQIDQFVQLNDGKIELNSSSEVQIAHLVKLNDS